MEKPVDGLVIADPVHGRRVAVQKALAIEARNQILEAPTQQLGIAKRILGIM